MRGTVDSFDAHVGLGTLTSASGDYPFHCTRISDGSRTIEVGAEVTFEVVPGRLGTWEADRVTRVGPRSAPPG